MQPTYTLAQALADLLEHTANRVADGVRSAGTLSMQQGHVRWLLQQFPPETPMEAINPRMLDDLATWARKHGGAGGRALNPRTVAKRLSTLRRAFNVAARRMRVASVPLFPEFANPAWKKRYRVLEQVSELHRLLAELPPHRALWVQIAFWTCQHASDVERMTWADVGSLDSEDRFVKIRNTKNRKHWLFKVRCPRELGHSLRMERDRLIAAGTPPTPERRLVQEWPNRSVMLTRACSRAQVKQLSANDLRHSGISAMVRKIGLTPGAQKWGGWSSFAMMEKYYSHALPPALDQCAAELDSWADEEAS